MGSEKVYTHENVDIFGQPLNKIEKAGDKG